MGYDIHITRASEWSDIGPGQEITAEAAPPETKIIDLMDALKASLAKKGGSSDEMKPAKRAPAQSEEPEAVPKKRKAAGRG